MHAALLSLQPQSVPALTLVGWLELGEAAEPDAAAAAAASGGSSFDEALAACAAKKDLEALMGKAALHAQRGQHREALEALNQVIVLYAWFPRLVEKFLVLVATGDWEQAVETAQRVLSQDAHNIEALRLSAAFLLSQEGAARSPRTASPTSPPRSSGRSRRTRGCTTGSRGRWRLAGRHAGVLQLTLSLVDRACRLAPARRVRRRVRVPADAARRPRGRDHHAEARGGPRGGVAGGAAAADQVPDPRGAAR